MATSTSTWGVMIRIMIESLVAPLKQYIVAKKAYILKN